MTDTGRALFSRFLAVVCAALLACALLIATDGQEQNTPYLRVHSPATGSLDLRMYLGVQPSPVPCPRGMYRPPGAGISLGECAFCPRGVYGDSPGLVSKDCTAKCPKGTYNDRLGAKSVLDCKICPAGVYGASIGLTSRECSGPCPNGKYSMTKGLQSISACLDCPANYRGPQGYRGNDIWSDNGGGFPCDRYLYGQTVLARRDQTNEDYLVGYLAGIREPPNQITDNSSP